MSFTHRLALRLLIFTFILTVSASPIIIINAYFLFKYQLNQNAFYVFMTDFMVLKYYRVTQLAV